MDSFLAIIDFGQRPLWPILLCDHDLFYSPVHFVLVNNHSVSPPNFRQGQVSFSTAESIGILLLPWRILYSYLNLLMTPGFKQREH